MLADKIQSHIDELEAKLALPSSKMAVEKFISLNSKNELNPTESMEIRVLLQTIMADKKRLLSLKGLKEVCEAQRL